MKNRISIILTQLILLLGLNACSGSGGKFAIDGKMANGSTMNLRVVYYGDDNVNNVLTAARDGRFAFEGNVTDDGAIVELLNGDYGVLGRAYVTPGDELAVTLNPANPSAIKITGNEVSERWAAWLHDNAKVMATRSATHINNAVAKYVREHPSDMLSCLLLLTEYDCTADPAGAKKLMQGLTHEARPASLTEGWVASLSAAAAAQTAKVMPLHYVGRADSLATFNPKTEGLSLLAFSNEYSGRRDSLLDALRRIAAKPGVRLTDLSLDNDTLTWRRAMRADTVRWTSGWIAGSVASPQLVRLGINRLPFFIVTDSTGRQIYRGGSVHQAEQKLTTLLSSKSQRP